MHILDAFPPINASSQASFAYFTITKRFPKIIADVKVSVDATYHSALDNLLPHTTSVIERFSVSDPERLMWEPFFERYSGQSWYVTPFFFLEIYFYRRIASIFNSAIDPFRITKRKDLTDNTSFITQVEKFASLPDQSIRDFLLLTLWGNKADLSQLTRARQSDMHNEFSGDHLLIDQSTQFEKELLEGIKRIDLVLDNAGVELLCDLVLVHELLTHYNVESIVLHYKPYPMFVSDAVPQDYSDLGEFIAASSYSKLKEIFVRLEQGMVEGRITTQSMIIWGTPVHLYDNQFGFNDRFKDCSLMIMKGDANYRRILGDKVIPHTQSLDIVADIYGIDILAIRTLKSELIIGMDAQLLVEMQQIDANWMTDGSNGVICYVKGRMDN